MPLQQPTIVLFLLGEPIITQTDNSGLSSGSFFPIGITTLAYQAVDGSGNISTCSFDIEVLEYPDPTSALLCNSGGNLALDVNCMATIGAQQLLSGGPYGCFDDYNVELFYDATLNNQIPGSPTIGPSEAGLTIYAKVNNPENNNYCVTPLNIQDNHIPSLTCHTLNLQCTDDVLPGASGVPFPFDEDLDIEPGYGTGPFTVNNFDPCGVTTLTFTDTEEEGDCVNDIYLRRYIRSWIAEDAFGNTSTCKDTIIILSASLDDVTLPDNRDDISAPALSCSGEYLLDANGNPSPEETGWPSINGLELPTDELCGIAAVYEDAILEICDGTNTILRTWTVLKWCPETIFFTDVQTITLQDTTPPSMTCPEDITVSTSQNNCLASIILPIPDLSDLCASATPSFTINADQGVLNGMSLLNIPLGVTNVTYIASDACGNERNCGFTITVEDQIPPTPFCGNLNAISLSSAGTTFIPAGVFNDNSFDNCSPVSLLVRRLDNPNCGGEDETAFDTQVPFYCCDLLGPNVMIELLVTDEAGNSNSCVLEVEVQDNLNPQLECPADLTLDCQQDPYDLNLTGWATATDNCAVSLSHVNQGGLDECNVGIIFRIWTAIDSTGNSMSCTQQIEVIDAAPFEEADIIWPLDYSTNDCSQNLEPEDLTLPFSEPQYEDGFCDLISHTHQDQYLPVNDPACVLILRTWSVYSWCVYEPGDPDADGLWQFTQVIEVQNLEAPTITSSCLPIDFCGSTENCSTGNVFLSITATDDCTDSSELNFTYAIDLFDDGNVDMNGGISEINESLPLGSHKVIWQVEDACGNATSCEQYFSISDCTPPIINVLNGLAIEMDETTQVTVWPMDWDNPNSPTFDNCGIEEWLIHALALGPGQTNPPVEASASWTFDCDQLGTQTVDIWVKDVSGIWAYVSTYVIVQDNDFPPDCPVNNYMMISGIVETEQAEEIENVQMTLSTNAPGIPDMEYSNANGDYGYPELIPGGDYMITPEMDVDPLNGVSTYDLVLLKQHLLEINELDSPYKMIAADVNNSGSISTIDILQLRKLILIIDTVFQNNNSWRFVDMAYDFPNSENPWESSFPEFYEVQEIQDTMIADFVGVKIGDLNNSATTVGFEGLEDVGFDSELNFKTKNFDFCEGEELSVSFTCDQFNQMLGFQSTIAFDQDVLDFKNIETTNLEILSNDCFGFSFLEKGLITMSWLDELGRGVDHEGIIFTLKFTAKSAGQLKDVLNMNSDLIDSEIYETSSIMKLSLGMEEDGFVFYN